MSIEITATVTQNIQVSDPREVHWHIGDTLHFPVGLGEAEFVCVGYEEVSYMRNRFYTFVSNTVWAQCTHSEVRNTMTFFYRGLPEEIKDYFNFRLPDAIALELLDSYPFDYRTGEIVPIWANTTNQIYDNGEVVRATEDTVAGICPALILCVEHPEE